MITMEKAIEALENKPDRVTLETYIAHAWVRPLQHEKAPYFEEIDIARARMIHQMQHDMHIDEHVMDVVLNLMDQLYFMHERMRQVHHAISRQPSTIREEITTLLRELEADYK